MKPAVGPVDFGRYVVLHRALLGVLIALAGAALTVILHGAFWVVIVISLVAIAVGFVLSAEPTPGLVEEGRKENVQGADSAGDPSVEVEARSPAEDEESALEIGVFDCARVPGKTCSVRLIGERNDVVIAARLHLVSVHGFEDGPRLEQNVNKAVDSEALSTPYITWA
jgi:hypothetical protein